MVVFFLNEHQICLPYSMLEANAWIRVWNSPIKCWLSQRAEQTPRKLLCFYRIEEGFLPAFADIKHQVGKLALANASENLAGRVENRPGQVEFCIGYIRDYPVRASAKKLIWPQGTNFDHWNLYRNSYIFIQENAFENVICEMVAIDFVWASMC